MFKKLSFSLALIIVSSGAFTQTTTYALDKVHSRLAFEATHFAISHVTGRFANFEVSFKSAKADFSDAVIGMIAEAKSIDTDNDMRDKDLRSEGWFNTEKYTSIEFKSTAFKKITDKSYKLEGIITIRGVSKAIVLDVTYNGKAMNPMSKKNSVGFTITGKLNRKDFGVGTDALESVVGNTIELKSDIELVVDSEVSGKKSTD
ncbi:MAG: polyisoprenoid-binding protein [Bacteroidia bacterium]|nr:polyisoprenoid-binding protein [Bacteroidia bacterium]